MQLGHDLLSLPIKKFSWTTSGHVSRPEKMAGEQPAFLREVVSLLGEVAGPSKPARTGSRGRN